MRGRWWKHRLARVRQAPASSPAGFPPSPRLARQEGQVRLAQGFANVGLRQVRPQVPRATNSDRQDQAPSVHAALHAAAIPLRDPSFPHFLPSGFT